MISEFEEIEAVLNGVATNKVPSPPLTVGKSVKEVGVNPG